jgi:hypothetical protein
MSQIDLLMMMIPTPIPHIIYIFYLLNDIILLFLMNLHSVLATSNSHLFGIIYGLQKTLSPILVIILLLIKRIYYIISYYLL